VPEDYVHRIGRTARAGAAGSAISFCSDEERPYLRDIERLTRLPLTVTAAPSAMRLANVPARRAPERALPPPDRARPEQPRPGSRGRTSQRPKHPSSGNRHHEATAADPLPAFLRRPQGKSTLQRARS
jgi:ATP-dependent RNA helicase RhlE